ncbi:hypothetical protein OSB04_000428 [Centaurea solstitialis]|uniref:Uncharacterized protein n=1 Tax=Centaurea solstitialis TaxID=347529 RepID=A0AA38U7D5_9ASTR|nr:hypothetical protein OSB04_000428 [Centaurea solstitialis]
MKELAMQELNILEAQHPTRFQYLKLQLKEFIHLLDEDEQQHSFQPKQHLSIITQDLVMITESTSRKRAKKEGEKDEGCTKRRRRRGRGGLNAAIQKAEACLCKIQTLKSFLCSSNR